MTECPQCYRYDVEYDPYTGHERCLWIDCMYIVGGPIDKKKFKKPRLSKKFLDCIKLKTKV